MLTALVISALVMLKMDSCFPLTGQTVQVVKAANQQQPEAEISR